MLLLLPAMACDSTRVKWDEPQGAPADTTGVIALSDDASPAFPSLRRFHAPADPGMCPHSVVSTMVRDRQYSAWLRLRPDSTVNVVAAEWDGRQWTAPAIVDSLDVGQLGCNRPSPSIAVSEADGYVHVAYSLHAPEGYGVFFSHSMDRGRSFHTPMIVVYGDRLSATAIAAHGTRVGIAYEVPSGSAKRVDVALSSTQGHPRYCRRTFVRGGGQHSAGASNRLHWKNGSTVGCTRRQNQPAVSAGSLRRQLQLQ
jgi:hypothetical protein